MKYLGESYDIHASGRELVFPHHENGIAIAGAVTGKPPARYWIHCDRVLVDGKKVDEKGDGLTLGDLIALGYSGQEIRYWLITVNYRKPVVFSMERLEAARNSLNRLNTLIFTLSNIRKGRHYPELDQLLYDIKNGFVFAMDDDLNISAAVASLFKTVKRINQLITEKAIDKEDARKIIEVFRSIDSVLNVFDFDGQAFDMETENLLKEREDARRVKNWELADEIRDQLRARGVAVKDEKI